MAKSTGPRLNCTHRELKRTLKFSSNVFRNVVPPTGSHELTKKCPGGDHGTVGGGSHPPGDLHDPDKSNVVSSKLIRKFPNPNWQRN